MNKIGEIEPFLFENQLPYGCQDFIPLSKFFTKHLKTKNPSLKKGFKGGPTRTRTWDQLIMSQLL